MFSLRFVFDFSSVDFGFSSVSIVDEGEVRINYHVEIVSKQSNIRSELSNRRDLCCYFILFTTANCLIPYSTLCVSQNG